MSPSTESFLDHYAKFLLSIELQTNKSSNSYPFSSANAVISFCFSLNSMVLLKMLFDLGKEPTIFISIGAGLVLSLLNQRFRKSYKNFDKLIKQWNENNYKYFYILANWIYYIVSVALILIFAG